MIEQWKKMVNHQESCEVDVWPELQNLTMDIISRAAFGSNYEEGKRLFELHKELIFFGFGSYADLAHSRFQVLITSLRC
jgi:cytochrome P450